MTIEEALAMPPAPEVSNARNFGLEVARSDPQRFGYLLLRLPRREATGGELAAWEARRSDPVYAALNAQSARAQAGGDISPLPVVAVPDDAAAAPAGEPAPDSAPEDFAAAAGEWYACLQPVAETEPEEGSSTARFDALHGAQDAAEGAQAAPEPAPEQTSVTPAAEQHVVTP